MRYTMGRAGSFTVTDAPATLVSHLTVTPAKFWALVDAVPRPPIATFFPDASLRAVIDEAIRAPGTPVPLPGGTYQPLVAFFMALSVQVSERERADQRVCGAARFIPGPDSRQA